MHWQAIFSIEQQNRLTGLDPRLKVGFSMAALLLAVITRNPFVPLGLTIMAAATLRLSGLTMASLVRRFLPAVVTGMVVFLTQLFWYGTTPLISWHLAGFGLTVYREGISHGLLLMLRVIGGMALMLFLTATTPVSQMVFAAHWLKVPRTVVEIMTVAYRYIFVLVEEMDRVAKAQRMRLGHTTWWNSMKSYGALGGIVILRVFDKSSRLYQAMQCRGYDGSMKVTYERKFSRADAWAGLAFVAILGLGLAASF